MSNTKKKLLLELQNSYGFSENFIESLQDGLLITDTQGEVLMVNAAACSITGFNKNELLNIKTPFPFWPKKYINEFNQRFKDFQEDHLKREFEAVYKHKNGEEFPVLVFLAAIKNTKSKVIAYLKYFQSISDLDYDIESLELSNKDIFSVLNYRKRYLNLMLERNISSQIERTLNNISDGLVSFDTNLCYTYANNRAGEILGKSPKELIGKHVWTVFPEAVGLPTYNAFYKAIETKETQYFEDYYEPLNKWFANKVYPHADGLTLYFIDITPQKNAERLIAKSEKYLNNIINKIGDPVFVKDEHSKVILANDAFCEMFNSPREYIIGKTLAEDVAPEERESFLKIDRHVLKTGEENVNEETLTLRGGETQYLSTKKTRFLDEEGNKFLVGIIRDVTKQKKAELEIKEARDYSESLIESMNEGLIVFNMETEITKVNPSFCKMSGFTEEELIGQQCPYPFSPPEIEDESNLRHEQIERGEELNNFETIYMRKDGTRFNVDVMVSSIEDSDGTIKSYFGTIIDTTERKKAELDLRAAKEFTSNLVMSMQEGLIITNLEGEVIMVNDSTCKILGYSKEELVGMQSPYSFTKKEDYNKILVDKKRIEAGESPSLQYEIIRKNGEQFLASFLTGAIKNETGEITALFGTMKDISEEEKAKKILEERAIQSSQKKDVILKLAELVGHDFKSSLKTITKLSAETLNVCRVSVWSFNDNNNAIHCEQLYELKSNSYEKNFTINYEDNPNYFKALESNKSILVVDAQNDNITKQFSENYLKPNKIKSLMDVFINSTTGYYGIICFEHVGEETRDWTIEEQEFASSIANVVSLMVESYERKIAEETIAKTNTQLLEANKQLNELKKQLEQENVYLRNELDLVFNYEEMVYGSVEFSNVLTEVERVAPTNATVLLLGESGTGKELLARAIHNTSNRNNKPLIKVNCSAIPRELIESELFGHKKGSFTGAFSDKVGKFELADGGTLFLDEIGELPIDMQPKILRFLQEGEIEVVGGVGLKKLNVRVIAATNRNLKEEIEKKQFREDLYFRLNVFPISIPPLRDRKDDIPLLVEHFVDKFNKAYEKQIKYISDEAMAQMKTYNWPGNIRELENLIERAVILTSTETLMIPGFETSTQKSKQRINSKDLSLNSVLKAHILEVLESCNWKISGPKSASDVLGLKPSTLRDKMTKLGIQKP